VPDPRLVLLALAICGLLVIGLSFAPWLNFEGTIAAADGSRTSFDLNGTDVSRLRDLESVGRQDIEEKDGWCSCRVDLGDGYFTALLGLGLLTVVGLNVLTGGNRPAALFAVTVSVGALGLTGWNAVADWGALTYSPDALLEEVEGSPTAWLWLLVAVEVAAAVLGTVLWVIVREADEDYDEYEDGEGPLPEGLNGWA